MEEFRVTPDLWLGAARNCSNVCQVLSDLSLQTILQGRDYWLSQFIEEKTEALRVKEAYPIPHRW